MTTTAPRPVTAPPLRRRGRRRERIAHLERPLLLAGLALITLHLLDLAFSGPATTVLGVLVIVVVPAVWALAQPSWCGPRGCLFGIAVGLLWFRSFVISHGLHVVNSGLDVRDFTGVGMAIGGLALVASGLTALTARGLPPRRSGLGWRAAHATGWLVGAAVCLVAVAAFAISLQITHAPRWAIQESSLAIPHQEVAIETADGRRLSAWYVPSRNRTAVLLSHGSGGSRERLVPHIRMLARHGYGVLALDNPGNGESEGHSNGLGDNASPVSTPQSARSRGARTLIHSGSRPSAHRWAARWRSRPPRATRASVPSSPTAPRARPTHSRPPTSDPPSRSWDGSPCRPSAACPAPTRPHRCSA